MYNMSDLFYLCHRYDKARLQKQQQKKLDKQEARMEKEMFIGNASFSCMSAKVTTINDER